MKTTTKVLMTALIGALMVLAQFSGADLKAEVALRAAIEKETVQGDLKGAIEQYKKLANNSDHAVAAKALITPLPFRCQDVRRRRWKRELYGGPRRNCWNSQNRATEISFRDFETFCPGTLTFDSGCANKTIISYNGSILV